MENKELILSSLFFLLTLLIICDIFIIKLINKFADVAELADALDLGSSIYDVQVQVLSSA